jgi:hypothetical protein
VTDLAEFARGLLHLPPGAPHRAVEDLGEHDVAGVLAPPGDM